MKNKSIIMDKSRAAVTLLNARPCAYLNESSEMEAFLSIFHPEIPKNTRKELARDSGKRTRDIETNG